MWGSILLVAATAVSLAWPHPGLSAAGKGAVVLVGDVLPFNKRGIWRRIAEQAPELVVIAAASERPALYGDYARRALERNGAYAELLPVALDHADFGTDHRLATRDPALVERVREADGIFFVGGAPQRLAWVLMRPDGAPTPMGAAVADAHAAGAVVAGGIAGSTVLSTGIDALEALATGRVPPAALHPGLGLVDGAWFVDQHAFTPGRFAEILVAMRQLGAVRGLAVGANTAAIVRGGQVEVLGDEGVLVFDLSGAGSESGSGFRLSGGRIGYLESGDRLDMTTLVVTPAADKLDGFEIEAPAAVTPSSAAQHRVVEDLSTPGRVAAIAARSARRRRPRGIRRRAPRGLGRRAARFPVPVARHARDRRVALGRIRSRAIHHRESRARRRCRETGRTAGAMSDARHRAPRRHRVGTRSAPQGCFTQQRLPAFSPLPAGDGLYLPAA